MAALKKIVQLKKIFEDRFSYKIKCHISNSHGLLNYKNENFDMVRVGFGLYYGFNNKDILDGDYGKILQLFRQKKLIKNLIKPLYLS